MKVRLFMTGFLQVFFVGLVTVFLANKFVIGAVAGSWAISFLWVENVRSVKPERGTSQYIYATGAATGTLCSYFISTLIIQLFK